MILIGTHAGVSIGQDGPSQMGLEDIAMMRAVHGSTVVSPSDAVSAQALVSTLIKQDGIRYIRATRGKAPILYRPEDQFPIGGSKVLKSSSDDISTIIATGIIVHEALTAYDVLRKAGISVQVIDMYSIKPIDVATLHRAASATAHFIVVEDHWHDGGLGDAVLNAFVGYKQVIPHITKLAITDMPRSGKPEQLLDKYGISAKKIVELVKKIASEINQ